MFCTKCGQKLNDGDVFCAKCGNRVAGTNGTTETAGTGGTPVAESTEPAIPDTPVVEQNAPVSESVSTDTTPPAAADSVASAPTAAAGHAVRTDAKPAVLEPGLKLPPKEPAAGAEKTLPQPVKSPDGKSRLAYQILALWGFFGVHNFYARRIVPACIQIMLTGAAIAAAIATQQPVWFLPVAVWCLVEIFAVRKDGKGRPWGEDFASAPGIEAIDPVVLGQFRCYAGRSIFVVLIAVVAIGAVMGSSDSDMGAGAICVSALCSLAIPCLLAMPWYYHARSKGYPVGYSLVLAPLGFFGFITLPVGLLIPIAAYRVARCILLKNGFKALSPAKKGLVVAGIIGSVVLAVAGLVCAVHSAEARSKNRSGEQYNKGVDLMKREEYKEAAKAFRKAADKGFPLPSSIWASAMQKAMGLKRT